MAVNTTNFKEQEKILAATAAVSLIENGDVVGLGTGSTATFAINILAERIKEGLEITGVCSSIQTEQLAKASGIAIQPLGDADHIDISIDGADEFTTELNLIKGGGGALFREKIVASLSQNRVIITDASKKVTQLGAFKVPIEVVPAAYTYVVQQLKSLNGNPILRRKDGAIFISDNQNFIVDVDFGLIHDPGKLSIQLDQVVGLLSHGLFIGLTTKIIMAKGTALLVYT